MTMDVTHHIFFGPPRITDECELKNERRRFIYFKFDNKGIDAANINNMHNLVFYIDILPLLDPS
jgi:hypothetical protein